MNTETNNVRFQNVLGIIQDSKELCEDKDGRKVVAAIVDDDYHCWSIGYNKFISNDEREVTYNIPKDKMDKDIRKTKYPYIIHAEMDAIMNMLRKNDETTLGKKIIVTYYPCNECAKLIIASGIKEVILYNTGYPDLTKDRYNLTNILFTIAGVKVKMYWEIELELNREAIKLELKNREQLTQAATQISQQNIEERPKFEKAADLIQYINNLEKDLSKKEYSKYLSEMIGKFDPHMD